MDTNVRNPKIARITSQDSSSSDQGDRLGSLPEPVAHHIFSFLETIDIIRASLVTRNWRYLWISMPYLSFDIHTNWPSSSTKKQSNRTKRERFKDFVNWVLMSRDGTIDIQRFRLNCFSYADDEYAVHRWIDNVAGRNVQELNLNLMSAAPFEFPQSLIASKSLVKLQIDFGNSQSFLRLPKDSGFSLLKSLYLTNLRLLNRISLQNFISHCPHLEILHIKACIFADFKSICISSTSLKTLIIDNKGFVKYKPRGDGLRSCKLHIACPGLLSLKLVCPVVEDLHFQDLTSLQRVFIYLEIRAYDLITVNHGLVMSKMLQGISSTRGLILSRPFLDEKLHLSLAEQGCSFSLYNLKSLAFEADEFWIQSTISLLNHCPKLEALTIYIGLPDERGFAKISDTAISCLTSHLKMVELLYMEVDDGELEFVRFLLEKGQVLQKMRIGWHPRYPKHSELVREVMEFHRSSPDVELIFFEVNIKEVESLWLV